MTDRPRSIYVLGIDPGLDGAVAILQEGDAIRLHPTPTLKAGTGARREYDVTEMVALLTGQPVGLAVIEAVGPRPGQGVTSMFRFGYGYGLWIGLLSALGMPFQLVTPQAWKKEILQGTTRDKTAAIQFVQRRFPAASLLPSARCRTPHDGMAEAACLAELARRLVAGSTPGRPVPPADATQSPAGHVAEDLRGAEDAGPAVQEACR